MMCDSRNVLLYLYFQYYTCINPLHLYKQELCLLNNHDTILAYTMVMTMLVQVTLICRINWKQQKQTLQVTELMYYIKHNPVSFSKENNSF